MVTGLFKSSALLSPLYPGLSPRSGAVRLQNHSAGGAGCTGGEDGPLGKRPQIAEPGMMMMTSFCPEQGSKSPAV